MGFDNKFYWNSIVISYYVSYYINQDLRLTPKNWKCDQDFNFII